jgi:hypothetical protein
MMAAAATGVVVSLLGLGVVVVAAAEVDAGSVSFE